MSGSKTQQAALGTVGKARDRFGGDDQGFGSGEVQDQKSDSRRVAPLKLGHCLLSIGDGAVAREYVVDLAGAKQVPNVVVQSREQ